MCGFAFEGLELARGQVSKSNKISVSRVSSHFASVSEEGAKKPHYCEIIYEES